MKKQVMNTAQPVDLDGLKEFTGNLYESIVVLGRRANQVQTAREAELRDRLEEVESYLNVSDDIYIENKEQVELSRYYERLAKPTLQAIQELSEGSVFYKYLTEDDK